MALLLWVFIIIMTISPVAATAKCTMSIASTTPAPPAREVALDRHAILLNEIKEAHPRLVLIGDSMAHSWPARLVAQFADGKQVFNFGLGGDRTEHTLWRLEQVQFDLTGVEVYIVAIGTNNLNAKYPACAVTAGIDALVEALRKRSPGASIIVLHIPATYRDGERYEVARKEVNESLDLMPRIITAKTSGALACDATDCSAYGSDRTHLSATAYAAISKEIKAALHR